MTAEELKEQGAIYFEKITEGFRSYADVKLVMDEKRAYDHFKSLKKEYGADHAFADFYYFRLDEESREMVDELLTADEMDYLQIIRPFPEETEEEIIFPLDDRLLQPGKCFFPQFILCSRTRKDAGAPAGGEITDMNTYVSVTGNRRSEGYDESI